MSHSLTRHDQYGRDTQELTAWLMLGCPILGTGQGLCTGGFPGSGSQKEEFEIHGKFIEGFQKLSETFWKLPESFWKLP